MARTCSVCLHPERRAIDESLDSGASLRALEKRWSIPRNTLKRHKGCPSELGLVPPAIQQAAKGFSAWDELRETHTIVKRLLRSCDEWLQDPSNPERHELGARGTEVAVVLSVTRNGKRSLVRGDLQGFFDQVTEGMEKLERAKDPEAKDAKVSVDVIQHRSRHTDPRKLLVSAAGQLRPLLALMGHMLGEIKRREELGIRDVLATAEWQVFFASLMAPLERYPEARAEVVEAVRRALPST